MEDTFTSIILVNYNGWHYLQPCLKALQKTKGAAFEIIVVDNGSRDESVALLAQQFPGVRVLAFRQNLGFGRANQKAIEIARGNYVVFLNNDTVHPELLELGWISQPESSRDDWWIAAWKKELWQRLDNWGIPLPAFLYRLLLAQAYAEGRKRGENRPAISIPIPSAVAVS